MYQFLHAFSNNLQAHHSSYRTTRDAYDGGVVFGLQFRTCQTNAPIMSGPSDPSTRKLSKPFFLHACHGSSALPKTLHLFPFTRLPSLAYTHTHIPTHMLVRHASLLLESIPAKEGNRYGTKHAKLGMFIFRHMIFGANAHTKPRRRSVQKKKREK